MEPKDQLGGRPLVLPKLLSPPENGGRQKLPIGMDPSRIPRLKNNEVGAVCGR